MQGLFLFTLALAALVTLLHLCVINRRSQETLYFSPPPAVASRRPASQAALNDSRPSADDDRASRDEEHHVFFLKVHKAASTTIMGVMLRFALSRKLAVMLPKTGNVFSQDRKFFAHSVLRLPEGRSHYDMLCNHLVFDEKVIRSTALHPDAKFLAIVRYPFDQFISAFQYYSKVNPVPYLTNIPGRNPIATYFKDPQRYEPFSPLQSYTNNRMMVDFGMRRQHISNRTHIYEYIDYLNRTFDLVMVVELFDESVLLMKRLLGWRLQDVLYIKANAMRDKRNYYFINQERKLHRKLRFADYALYSHFYSELKRKVSAAGPSLLEELHHFRDVLAKVENFCLQPKKSLALVVDASLWNEEFRVSYLDCVLLKMKEMEMVDLARRKLGPYYSWPELMSFNALFF